MNQKNTINWSLKKFLVKDLKEYHKNPRKLSKNDYEQLSTSISKFGLIDKPVCLKSGQIIGGHQRKKVLEKLGIKEVDCWVPDREISDKEVEELCLRLNKNTGEFDYDILANQFDCLDLLNWGFDAGDLLGMDKIEDEDLEDEEEKGVLKMCPHCGKEI